MPGDRGIPRPGQAVLNRARELAAEKLILERHQMIQSALHEERTRERLIAEDIQAINEANEQAKIDHGEIIQYAELWDAKVKELEAIRAPLAGVAEARRACLDFLRASKEHAPAGEQDSDDAVSGSQGRVYSEPLHLPREKVARDHMLARLAPLDEETRERGIFTAMQVYQCLSVNLEDTARVHTEAMEAAQRKHTKAMETAGREIGRENESAIADMEFLHDADMNNMQSDHAKELKSLRARLQELHAQRGEETARREAEERKSQRLQIELDRRDVIHAKEMESLRGDTGNVPNRVQQLQDELSRERDERAKEIEASRSEDIVSDRSRQLLQDELEQLRVASHAKDTAHENRVQKYKSAVKDRDQRLHERKQQLAQQGSIKQGLLTVMLEFFLGWDRASDAHVETRILDLATHIDADVVANATLELEPPAVDWGIAITYGDRVPPDRSGPDQAFRVWLQSIKFPVRWWLAIAEVEAWIRWVNNVNEVDDEDPVERAVISCLARGASNYVQALVDLPEPSVIACLTSLRALECEVRYCTHVDIARLQRLHGMVAERMSAMPRSELLEAVSNWLGDVLAKRPSVNPRLAVERSLSTRLREEFVPQVLRQLVRDGDFLVVLHQDSTQMNVYTSREVDDSGTLHRTMKFLTSRLVGGEVVTEDDFLYSIIDVDRLKWWKAFTEHVKHVGEHRHEKRAKHVDERRRGASISTSTVANSVRGTST